MSPRVCIWQMFVWKLNWNNKQFHATLFVLTIADTIVRCLPYQLSLWSQHTTPVDIKEQCGAKKGGGTRSKSLKAVLKTDPIYHSEITNQRYVHPVRRYMLSVGEASLIVYQDTSPNSGHWVTSLFTEVGWYVRMTPVTTNNIIIFHHFILTSISVQHLLSHCNRICYHIDEMRIVCCSDTWQWLNCQYIPNLISQIWVNIASHKGVPQGSMSEMEIWLGCCMQ